MHPIDAVPTASRKAGSQLRTAAVHSRRKIFSPPPVVVSGFAALLRDRHDDQG
ncbi:hypothetical protein ACFO6Q_07610 [Dokdonella ginsengisoli]|uniref:Uncharacterized protein n=1 Tax=Dokdonella ginsengisoli TaxID=363846 RepID=A0ABV9QT28_9GAMM